MLGRIGISFVWFVAFACFSAKAQQPLSSKHKKAIQQYQNGIQALQQRKNTDASLLFGEAINTDSLFAEAYYQLARLSEQAGQKEKALYFYEKTFQVQDSSLYRNNAIQSLAYLYQQLGKYEPAQRYFTLSLKSLASHTLAYKRAQKGLASTNFALEAVKHPLAITPNILDAPFNTFDAQYFPVLTADQESFIFTAQQQADRNENIYISYYKNGQWTTPLGISEQINSADNEGTTSISADGRTLVFTICNAPKGLGSCDLYISYKQGETWTKPINMGNAINSIDWDAQPALSADGTLLYFASDRRGGQGNKDIWMSRKDSLGHWQKAINLGNVINTPDDDVSPFIHANSSTLFFSSAGHIGMGGLDIFMSEKTNSTWQKPENLGFPLNNAYDQVGFFVTADRQKAYYSSDVAEQRQHKIKLISIDLPAPLQAKITPTTYLKGIVRNALTQQPLEASIELVSLQNPNTVQHFSSDPITGTYTAVLNQQGAYALFVQKPNYLFKSLHFDLTPQTSLNTKLNISLSPIQKNAQEILNNIFFDRGQWELQPTSITELQKLVVLLEQNPQLSLTIAGHTDDIGKDSDNLVLSQKRAKAVLDFLVQKGISPQRLKAEGYGETRPLVENTNEENRQRNRRIEIKWQ